jgi:short-subunit dehydrogenase
MAVCPGPTESSFFEAADFPKALASGGQSLVPAAVVVEEALQALARKQPNVVTGGIGNQLMVNASRFLPRPTLVNSIAKLFRPKVTPNL